MTRWNDVFTDNIPVQSYTFIFRFVYWTDINMYELIIDSAWLLLILPTKTVHENILYMKAYKDCIWKYTTCLHTFPHIFIYDCHEKYLLTLITYISWNNLYSKIIFVISQSMWRIFSFFDLKNIKIRQKWYKLIQMDLQWFFFLSYRRLLWLNES